MQPENDGWDLTDTSRPLPLLRQESPDEGWICDGWVEQDGWSITSGTTCYCDTGYTFDYEGDSGCVEQEEGCIGDNCEEEPPDDPGDPEDPEEEETPGDPSGDPDGDDDAPQDTITVSLECDSPVVRGSELTCTLTTNPSGVTLTDVQWSAEVPELVPSPSQSGGMQWSGTVVRPIIVNVAYTLGGTPWQLSADISVTPRSWWSWEEGNWYHSRETGDAPSSWFQEPDWDVDWERGKLCPATGSGCAAVTNPYIFPDFRLGQGYVITSIEAGPNAGLSWVSSVSLGTFTESWVNPGMKPVWPDRSLPEGEQADACRAAMDLDPDTPVYVDFYSFNASCKGKPMAVFLDAALDHEEEHHDMLVAAAALAENDAHSALEGLVRTSASELDSEVQEKLAEINLSLRLAAHASEPTGNWSSTVWIWQSSANEYVESGVWHL